MSELMFKAHDNAFGLTIPASEAKRMVSLCRKAKSLETGGIIIGHYNSGLNHADVTELTGPPEDSGSGRTWFKRGVRGLQRLIDKLWHENQTFYLGEWHYHPGANALPSPTDISQMIEICSSTEYACPEPILVILGGNPHRTYEVRAFVFVKTQKYIELLQVSSNPPIAVKKELSHE